MGPRKKAKTSASEPLNPAKDNPPAHSSSSTDNSKAEPPNPTEPVPIATQGQESSNNAQVKAIDANRIKEQFENRKSWYGSWNQKSAPKAQVSQEVLSTSAPVNKGLEQRKRPSTPGTPNSPKRLMSGSSSVKDVPLAASMTRLEVTSRHSSEAEVSQKDEKKEEASEPSTTVVPDPPLPPDPMNQNATKAGQPKENSQAKQPASSGWFGWWSRPDGYDEKEEQKKRQIEAITEEAKNTPLPGLTPQPSPEQSTVVPPTSEGKPLTEEPKLADQVSTTAADGTQSRSWFWLWSKSQNAQVQEVATAPDNKESQKSDDSKKTDTEQAKPVDSSKAAGKPSKPPEVVVEELAKDTLKEPLTRRKSNSWAFWSKEKPDSEQKADGSVHKQVGEIAVADTPSQSHPEAAQFNEQEAPLPKDKDQLKPKATQPRGRKEKDTPSKPSTPSVSTPSKVTPSQSPTLKATEPAPTKQLKQAAKAIKDERVQPDLLLPEFRNTYSLLSESSFWEKIRRFFLNDSAESSALNLHITKDPPRIKKAIAIGIHGFFPAPIFQAVLGPPTGTSIRFSNQAASAIKSWCEERGWHDVEIEKVALEGEGFIQERVDTLWKLLLNWIEHIRQADFILIAAHSQGVPVAIMLIAKLISFGCVNAARVGVCAMAGVNLGPFAEYRTRMFGASALELFDFSNPESAVSTKYMTALDEVLKFGVRVVYVGSIDDQLVSLESSTFSNISHPYIYRAVFIGGRLHSPDL